MKGIDDKDDMLNQVNEMMPLSTEEQNDIFDGKQDFLDSEI